MSEADRKLIDSALNVLKQSYSPYSKFRVGAALRTTNGEIFDGCNVENVSYGLTICAERNAVFKMVSFGERKLESIAVVTDSESIVTPCGACRQVIREFADDDCRIICASPNEVRVFALNQLLPFSFKPSDLT
ncbi:MAG: cytidine deaminase [candidate division Zixibacteria bacterium]|nr:cytidine deaminase [candidate division Zixibacteria bacterium]